MSSELSLYPSSHRPLTGSTPALLFFLGGPTGDIPAQIGALRFRKLTLREGSIFSSLGCGGIGGPVVKLKTSVEGATPAPSFKSGMCFEGEEKQIVGRHAQIGRRSTDANSNFIKTTIHRDSQQQNKDVCIRVGHAFWLCEGHFKVEAGLGWKIQN
ncbi:hypothetical protein AVEN_53473-1 [Araneus ventricosus]|uniref:Uncharacterized protein n=1 Tax=Araneus ventricosus TaxID=182803 RepID=A0A4Y2AAU5_ARAVE|nr:hypothetical protein AVEN_53473-1 [Araneus ventricosus]